MHARLYDRHGTLLQTVDLTRLPPNADRVVEVREIIGFGPDKHPIHLTRRFRPRKDHALVFDEADGRIEV